MIIGASSYTMAAPDGIESGQGPSPNNTNIPAGEIFTFTSDKPSVVGDITLAGTLVAEVDATIDGDLTLKGGTVDLSAGTTLTMDKLTLEETSDVLVDIDAFLAGETLTLFVVKEKDFGTDGATFTFSELENYRKKTSWTDSTDGESSTFTIELSSAKLTWRKATDGDEGTNTWGVGEAGGEWDASDDVDDKHYYDRDDVTFTNAGDVEIVGDVNPGSITVNGAEDTTFTGNGHLTGDGALTKTGKGTLTIETENEDYSGTIKVSGGGTLKAGVDHALGTGDVSISGSTLDGNNKILENKITISGTSTITGTVGMKDVTFARNAKVSGDFTLGTGNTLTVGTGVKFNNIDDDTDSSFTFAGGTIQLTGTFTVNSSTVDFNESSTIDLSLWSSITYGRSYTLMQFTDTDLDLTTILDDPEGFFTLEGLEESLRQRASLSVDEDGNLILTIDMLTENPAVLAGLTQNQKTVYSAIFNIANTSYASGPLYQAMKYLIESNDPYAVRQLLAKLSGEELATMMSSQIQGNLTHMHRLRSHIGTGQSLFQMDRMKGEAAAYVSVFNDQHNLKNDTKGPGHRRSEWGGTLGVETHVSERTLMGVSLSSGQARVTPSGDSDSRYREGSTWIDWYMLRTLGTGWRSVTTAGIGSHSYHITRELPFGLSSTAEGLTGRAFNISQEFSYSIMTSQATCLQPFFTVQTSMNTIKNFIETGGESLSLAGDKRRAWATDAIIGARLIHTFGMVSHAPAATLSLQAGLVTSVGDQNADLTVRFVGAPDTSFTLTSAKRKRIGGNMNVGLSLPLSQRKSFFGSVGATVRGNEQEVDATVGMRFSF